MNILRRIFGQPASVPTTRLVQPNETRFPEEPLSLSAEQGFGFFPARAGLFLNNGRYQILRKLGRGQFSTTWLVSDSQAQETPAYYAVKILTAHATVAHQNGLLLELEIMKAITELKRTPALPYLFDHFETEGPHGQHLCLVQPVSSTDISRFRRSAPSKMLGFPTVKIIIAQILQALVPLHAAGIIHTDLKPDNVLFLDGTAPNSIQELLNDSPIFVDGEFELNGVNYPIIHSQPIPHQWNWNDPATLVELYTVRLVDFGHAQWMDREPTTRMISAYGLRAPEVILGADFDTKVDIWSLGCMTFELLTGRWLFHPMGSQTWRVEDDHLAKMMDMTGETFSEAMLSASRNRDDYFDKDGKLLRIDQMFPSTLEAAMMSYNLPETEVAPAASFIRSCLHLNPDERSSARDLAAHPWLEKAFMCC